MKTMRSVIIPEVNNKKFVLEREIDPISDSDSDYDVISFKDDKGTIYAGRFFDSNLIPHLGDIKLKELTDREKVLCWLTQSFIIKHSRR